jgi:hypothetical protein
MAGKPQTRERWLIVCACAVVIASTSAVRRQVSVAASGQALSESALLGRLEARLLSATADEFHSGVAALALLDRPGLQPLWNIALKNPNADLRRAAWSEFRRVRQELLRKEFVPRVVRV